MYYNTTEERLAAVNAACAAASGIPFQPFDVVQQREINALSEALEDIAAVEICGIVEAEGTYRPLVDYDTCNTRNPKTGRGVPNGTDIVQMLAGERYREYIEACRDNNDRMIDPRWAPSYDEADPLTHTRLYVLTSRYERLVPLEVPYDWISFLLEMTGRITKCEVHLLHRCYDQQARPALRTLVYKRGEILCAFKICNECLDALSWVRYGHPDYAGPTDKFTDDGTADSRFPYDDIGWRSGDSDDPNWKVQSDQ